MKYTLSIFLFCLCFSVNAQVNLSSGLVAYYPFNGNANDASGNNINGTNTNAVLTTDQSGAPNSAYYFDGSTSYIQLPYSNLYNFSPSGTFSLSAWIQPDNNQSWQYQAIAVKSPYNPSFYGSNWNYGLYLSNYHAMSGFAGNNFLNGTTTLTPNQCWHHILLTYQNGNWSLYVNGQLEAYDYSQTKFILQDASSAICFGKKGEAFGDWYKGKMDEVRLYNRVINQQEIAALSTRTVPCGQTIINQYAAVTSRQSCDNIITVDTAAAFNVGDTILMIQMKGAVIDSSNTASFGNILDYKGAGNYEYNVIKAKNGNNLTLKYRIVRHYDIPDGKVQIVRVPSFQNYTVNTLHTCMPWNGSKGGVFAIHVNNTLTLNADIDVSGKGFRGGQLNSGNTYACSRTDYYYPASGNDGGIKGEGIAMISDAKMRGMGKLANGGGGGNNTNAGGGGGSNAAPGGSGGHQWNGCDTSLALGGNGGMALTYSTAANRMFMGGGGGCGHENDGNTDPAGNGGGIMLIDAANLAGNAQHLKLNGANCVDNKALSAANGDGQSGGGAGGTLLLKAASIASPLAGIEANGGNGGNIYVGIFGPGGGGSGGMFLFAGNAIPSSGINLAGGANGTIINYGIVHDARPGQSGQTLSGVQFSFPVDTFKHNQINAGFTDSVVNCYTRRLKDASAITTTGIASWLWTFPDGSTAAGQTAAFTFSGYGIFPVKLVVTDSNGCRDSITKNITIPYTHFADAGKDTVTCEGVPAILHASGGVSYSWSPAAGLDNPGGATTKAAVSVPSDFVVTVTNGAGCIDKDTVHVGIIQGATITAMPEDTAVCVGKKIMMTAYGGVSYSWSPAAGLDNANISDPVAVINGPVDYIVTGTGVNGCIARDTVHVSIRPGPQVYATSDGKDITCYQSSVQLFAHGAQQYVWSPAAYCNDSTSDSPIVDPSVTTIFTVTGTDAAGCTASDTITVKSYKDVVIFIPDAFTPNGDGRNDVIRPRIFCEFVFGGFYVMNRWGETIYMTNHIQGAWDGTFNGVPQPMGVYHYMVRGTDSRGESVILKGNFTLIR